MLSLIDCHPTRPGPLPADGAEVAAERRVAVVAVLRRALMPVLVVRRGLLPVAEAVVILS